MPPEAALVVAEERANRQKARATGEDNLTGGAAGMAIAAVAAGMAVAAMSAGDLKSRRRNKKAKNQVHPRPPIETRRHKCAGKRFGVF